jgi:hypothetical protein
LHVEQEWLWQVEQPPDESFSLLPPPPMPKEEMSFRISLLPQASQLTHPSFPSRINASKCRPHERQTNS